MRGGSCAVLRASGRRPGAQRPGWFGVRNPMETPTMPVLPPILFLPPRRGGDLGDRGGGMPAGGWGFCSIRSLLSACRRRVAALMLQFPPFAGGEDAVRGGVAPTVQTTSVKNG
ncbi:hypothetical protein HMPREF1980_01835 [Actinomyces sp. oral taxon 172 str. F0311]|nr:hypothetical protein HMPREF1980_01835 [Actinomyces sp. oral taxon 172 str. F0311]